MTAEALRTILIMHGCELRVTGKDKYALVFADCAYPRLNWGKHSAHWQRWDPETGHLVDAGMHWYVKKSPEIGRAIPMHYRYRTPPFKWERLPDEVLEQLGPVVLEKFLELRHDR